MKMVVDDRLEVNSTRFLDTFRRIASIGMDQRGAVSRLALDLEDVRAREALVKALQSINAEIRIDDVGNIYGLLNCGSTSNTIAIGSHLDSVPEGGRFDGAYGVIGGLEVLRTISDMKIKLRHNLLLVNFTNEEGARFTPGISGSAVATGLLKRDVLYSQRDANGVSFREALWSSGFMGQESNRIMYHPPSVYLELHIEQGPILYSSGFDIGVVEGVQGIVWLEVSVHGQANHAGTTPMRDRKDALTYMAKVVLRLMEFARSNEKLVATVGRVELRPNAVNIVPGFARFFIDLRSPSRDLLRQAVVYTNQVLKENSEEGGVTFELRDIETYLPTSFDSTVVDAVEYVASAGGYKHTRLYSGAGHDAQNMAKITRAGMIFIPSKDGISHCRDEYSADKHLVIGVNTLLNTVLYLDKKL